MLHFSERGNEQNGEKTGHFGGFDTPPRLCHFQPFLLHHTGFAECCDLRLLLKLTVYATHIEQMTIRRNDPQT